MSQGFASGPLCRGGSACEVPQHWGPAWREALAKSNWRAVGFRGVGLDPGWRGFVPVEALWVRLAAPRLCCPIQLA